MQHVMVTASGRLFDVKDPRPDRVCEHDIATGLAHVCRFAGQCRFHYSVAQHSVLVAEVIFQRTQNPRIALVGLLHDAAEAYLGDVPTPVKSLIPDYEWIELRVMQAIARAFELEVAEFDAPDIHTADRIALATERRDLLPPDVGGSWEVLRGVMPVAAPIVRKRIQDAELDWRRSFTFYRAKAFA